MSVHDTHIQCFYMMYKCVFAVHESVNVKETVCEYFLIVPVLCPYSDRTCPIRTPNIVFLLNCESPILTVIANDHCFDPPGE